MRRKGREIIYGSPYWSRQRKKEHAQEFFPRHKKMNTRWGFSGLDNFVLATQMFLSLQKISLDMIRCQKKQNNNNNKTLNVVWLDAGTITRWNSKPKYFVVPVLLYIKTKHTLLNKKHVILSWKFSWKCLCGQTVMLTDDDGHRNVFLILK